MRYSIRAGLAALAVCVAAPGAAQVAGVPQAEHACQRECLEGLGSGAEEGDAFRVARRRAEGTAGVHDGHVNAMTALRYGSAKHIDPAHHLSHRSESRMRGD